MNKAAYLFLVLTVALAAGFAGFHFSQRNNVPGRTQTDNGALERIRSLELPDTQGKPQPLGQWRGRILVINFWATWCPPCRREIPGFARLSRKYEANGVQFVGIGVDDGDKVRGFTNSMAIPYPILMGNMDLFQITENLGNPTQALPFTLILDRKGTVAFIREGMLEEESLEQTLKSLISAS
ncbi:MAG: TlpA disulfide reductase family protein [Rhodocyclaceae bacterium]|nr:TlpA disulfide reductase family protein [Rhodocyclaceae bacterium]